MSEQIDPLARLCWTGIVLGSFFAYFLVGAVYAGIAKRVAGGRHVFPPNFIFWPVMMPAGLVIVAYALASGQKVRDLDL